MNWQQVQEALETSRKIIHQRIDEIAAYECDLIDQKLEELLMWNEEVSHRQELWLWSYRAKTLIDKCKVYQYDYNIQMYKLQLEAQKSVSSP